MKKLAVLIAVLCIFNFTVFSAEDTDLSAERELINSVELHPDAILFETNEMYEESYYNKYGVTVTAEYARDLIAMKINELTDDSMDTFTKLLKVYDWLVYNVEYGFGGFRNYVTVHGVLENRIGTCVDFSYTFDAVCRYIGLDSKCVNGVSYFNDGSESIHTWVEVTINGEQYVFDPQVQNYIYVRNDYNDHSRFCKTFDSLVKHYRRHEPVVRVTEPDAVEEVYEYENVFIDISEDDTYYDSIKFVCENNIFKGMSDTEFDPDRPMTRAMFVTALGRGVGIDTELYKDGTKFDDVKENEWYTEYINWGVANNLLRGYGDDIFGTNDLITHGQMGLIMNRFFEYMNTYGEAAIMGKSDDSVKRWEVAVMLHEVFSYIKY